MTALISDPNKRGIIIIDDEPVVLETLKECLTGEGYQSIYTAEDGVEAMSVLAANPENIYLCLLDLWMPGMDGFTFIRHITSVHRYCVGVIIITGHGNIETETIFAEMGNDYVIPSSFIEKPLSLEKLILDVREALEKVHARRIGHLEISANEIHARLDQIDDKLKSLGTIGEINTNVNALLKHKRGFLAELGMDVVRIITIAFAVLSLLYLGVGEFLSKILMKIK